MFEENVYYLKQRFGVKADLYHVDVEGVVDDFAATQNIVTSKSIVKVVLLPVTYKIEEELNQRFKGDVKVGDRQMLIEEPVTTGDYVVHRGRRWDIIDVTDYEGNAQLALVRNVQDES